MPRRSLSDRGVSALKPRAARYNYADPELVGHYIRVQPSGTKSFAAVTRGADGKQRWVTIGPCDATRIDDAREQARTILTRLRAGLPAREKPPESYREVAESYVLRHIVANGLISRGEMERSLKVYVLPSWGDLPFVNIRRGEVTRLLDAIEDKHGQSVADHVLRLIRGIANWYAARNDNYVSPFVRGMRRARTKARARVLSDDEIRSIWQVAETGGTFGAFVRISLICAQRKDKVRTMRWDAVSVDGVWNIAAADRAKGTAGVLKLPALALDILKSQPRLGSNPYVFPGRGDNAFNGFSKAKRAFDAKLPDVKPWVIHDLRRSARSLLSRAGVRPDVSERVMGHAIAGVEGVYDRYHYTNEMGAALEKLANLISAIIDSRESENVVPMQKRGKRR
jgi:integrase